MFEFFRRKIEEPENKEVPDQVPFNKLDKVGEGKYFEVHLPIDDPGLVVKRARTRWADPENEGVHPLADLERIKTDIEILKDNFGDFIPDSQLVVGKNQQGEKTVYIIQDRIIGQDLGSLKFDESVNEQLKSFLEKCLDIYIKNLVYYGDNTQPKSLTLDLKGENFIFGTDKKKNNGNRLYFIDTYPVEGSTPSEFIRGLDFESFTFSGFWVRTILDFKRAAEIKMGEYLEKNRGSIPRIPSVPA